MTDSFDALSLDKALLRALEHEGYTRPTEIQSLAIPHALAGKDVLAIAPTGTGKTAAFTLPTLQKLAKGQRGGIRALVLTPTRELALQVEEALSAYGRHMPLTSGVIMGGVNENPQIKMLKRGVDILVATPGRLLDLMQRNFVKLDKVEVLVLDEADRMLDMGFIHDVRKICNRVPQKRQTLFFSATMPAAVAELANTLCKDPARVDVDPTPIGRPQIEQKVMFVDQRKKQELLTHILKDEHDAMVLVFSRTKHRADRIVKSLQKARIRAGAIHSNKTQGARQRALADFAEGRTRVLVATDIAARGIDVDGITHVINFDLSDEPENHVHRIGRTARAGASGVAISFCDREELKKLAAIEKANDTALTHDDSHPFHNGADAQAYIAQVTAQPKKAKTGRGGWPKPRRRGRKTRRNAMR
ncbi:MAG: DEAD/DEAH box helicase [Planctomycetes bacterium]|nr:DEAD/DEAH box helicase [Planctomycetota bacterium]